jgi:adenine deaminase
VKRGHRNDAREDLGTIEPGNLSDLVLLTAEPLADHNTRKIDAVIAGGKLLRRHYLDALRRQAEAMASRNGAASCALSTLLQQRTNGMFHYSNL